jgi:hypothetical protein
VDPKIVGQALRLPARPQEGASEFLRFAREDTRRYK